MPFAVGRALRFEVFLPAVRAVEGDGPGGHESSSSLARMVQAAKLYYDMERTQSEIAKELGLTRWQVGRLIHDAREIGWCESKLSPALHADPI